MEAPPKDDAMVDAAADAPTTDAAPADAALAEAAAAAAAVADAAATAAAAADSAAADAGAAHAAAADAAASDAATADVTAADATAAHCTAEPSSKDEAVVHGGAEAAAGQEASSLIACPLKVTMTGPPVRLRMASADKLCPRSMLVEWEDGSEERQCWVSSEDPLQSGWYEAEKLLPPSATNISVRFKIRGLHKKWDVCMVDRQNGCSWILLGEKRYAKEVICFRVGSQCACDPIDAVFELKGPMHRCFLHRAWNAATEGACEEWEYWDDEDSRPPLEGKPATLVAADAVAVPKEFDCLEEYTNAVTNRFCAAAFELLDVHRTTLRALSGLDATCTGRWLRANVGTTTSAGLMIAAVPMFFVLPPVGIGLAVAGSVAGGAAISGDSLQERWSLAELRRQLSRDGWNAFVTAELLKEWLRATAAAAAAAGSPSASVGDAEAMGPSVSEKSADTGAMGAVKTGVYAVAMFGDEAAAALPVLGPIGIAVGAVLTTGIAIHGWTTCKFSQKEVRGKMEELKHRLLALQSLLARLGKLECPICCTKISETEPIIRCADNAHCYHARCLQADACPAVCPVCAGSMDANSKSLADVVKDAGSNSSGQVETCELASSEGASASTQVLDESLLWAIVAQLDALEILLAEPAETAAEMMTATIKFNESTASCQDLEELAGNPAEHPDELDFCLGISDTLERLQRVAEQFENWKIQASPSVAAEFAKLLEDSQADVRSTSSSTRSGKALSFQPPDRTDTNSTSAASVASSSDSSRTWSAKMAFGKMGKKMSGSMGMAAQKASAFGQSASQKAAAAASELKDKAKEAKDKAAASLNDLAKTGSAPSRADLDDDVDRSFLRTSGEYRSQVQYRFSGGRLQAR